MEFSESIDDRSRSSFFSYQKSAFLKALIHTATIKREKANGYIMLSIKVMGMQLYPS